MAIIKAKYNNLVRPYMKVVKQGFGSVYGGNQISSVTNVDSRASNGQVGSTSTGNMFIGNRVLSYVNLNTGQELIFTNDSVFIVNQSTLSLTEIDTLTALSFVNSSDWTNRTEFVSNGGFDTSSDWFLSTSGGWSIDNGKLEGSSADGFARQLIEESVSGYEYRVSFEISDYVSGSVAVGAGTNLAEPKSDFVSGNGVYFINLTIQGSTVSIGFDGDNFNGSIDNVSINLVSTNTIDNTSGSAIEYITENESEWVTRPLDYDTLLSSIQERATYYENEQGSIDILTELLNCK